MRDRIAKKTAQLLSFRPEAPGMFSSSRYFATVRRETGKPSAASASHSSRSDRGRALSSPSMSRRRAALAAAI